MKKIIELNELIRLLRDSERLKRLESCGVKTWYEYDNAMSNEYFDVSYQDWVDTELDDLLNDYPNYNRESYNYNYE